MNTNSDIDYTFRCNRRDIGKILSNRSSYNDIIDTIKYFQSINGQNNYLQQAMLGQLGYETNATSAIPMIFTDEFMYIVYSIQLILDVFEITEMQSGMGLFSCMYSNFCNLHEIHSMDVMNDLPKTQIESYDCFNVVETSSTNKFYSIKNKSLKKFMIDKTNLENKICIFNMPNDLHKYIKIFLCECKPAGVIVTMEREFITNIIHSMNDISDYSVLKIVPKVFSYLDICNNYGHIRRTRTLIITKVKITPSMIESTVKDILMFDNKIFDDTHFNKSESIFIRCVMSKKLPFWMLGVDKSQWSDILVGLYNALKNGKCLRQSLSAKMYAFINENIKNIDEFTEYINWKPSPPILCTSQKFIDYRTLYRKISNFSTHNIPISELKALNIIPDWIDTYDDALLYTYLTYEYKDSDAWKLNKETFEKYKN